MATHLYSIKIECIHCKKKFETLKPKSKSCIIISKDTDFCCHYKDAINPYFYEVTVCPECGFAFTQNFNRNLSDEAKKKFHDQVASNWYKRYQFSFARTLGTAIDANKLALITGNLVDEKKWVIAGIALRLGWFYRYQGKLEDELKFLSLARNLYMTSYENEGLRGCEIPEINIIYLLGELSARVGDSESAIKWFSKVTEHETRGIYKALVAQARDRWQEVRSEAKKAQ